MMPLAINTAIEKYPYSSNGKTPESTILSVCVTNTQTDAVNAMLNENFRIFFIGLNDHPTASGKLFARGNTFEQA
ncbi:hypothetical protein D9M71_775380 [compost metagenome]